MTWQAPTPTLKVALGHGRFTDNTVLDDPDHASWTDLSDRITDDPWTVQLCERSSVRDDFAPGELQVTLNNDDRELDPSNPDGLVYAPDGQGLPGSPVFFSLAYNGTEERRFTGYLASPAWEGSGSSTVAGQRVGHTVTLTARDRLDWSGDLPDSSWAAATIALRPDWYLPMDPPNAVLSTGSEIPDRSGTTTASATTTVPTGLARPHQGPGGWVPWMALPPGSTITSDAADVMPDGDETGLTVWCWWSSEDTIGTGDEAMVLKMVNPGGSTRRWAVWVDDAGVAQIATYDSGGTLIDSDTITRPSGRWDSGSHFVVVRFTSGSTMKVWFGGYTATLTAASFVYESDLVCGPADVDVYVDEVTLFRRTLTDDQVAGVLLDAGGYIGQWFGQSYADRLSSWTEAAGIEVTSDWSTRWRVPVDDTTTEGFVSLNVATMPQNLADAYRQTVGPGGTVVADRHGFLVARDVTALTSGDYDPQYVDTSAHFTDEDATLTGVQLRHAGVARGAVDEDSVINRVESSFYYLISLGPPVDLQQLTFRPESTTLLDGRRSFEQFGRRTWSESRDRYGWLAATSRANALISRYPFPVAGFDLVALDAINDDDLTEWLMTAEPEVACDVTYAPRGGDPVTVTGLNLQGLIITGTTTSLSASARLFRS